LARRNDIVFGMPVLGRDQKSVQSVLGPFAGVLVLKVEPPPAASPRERVANVHAAVSDVLALPPVGVDELVQALRIPRNPSRPRLLHAVISFLDNRGVKTPESSLGFEPVDLPLTRSDSEIALWCSESELGLKLVLSCSADLFSLTTAETWLARLVVGLEELADHLRIDSVADVAQNTPAPKDGHAALLAGIWKELLRNDAITEDDNFFELGGHSLLALSMVSRVELATGKRLPLLRVGDSSLGALAAMLDAQSDDTATPTPPEAPASAGKLGGWLRKLVGQTNP
jgi:acyl carrier protein